ncbi:hypothetical protein MTX78_07100 [Hymenobacter tibetensis]|uniref:DUF4349 domain-containing protein n=1 Tax=Hymenobacter tibetensis TaxID=497967 RepID=A0ABY4D382_9BACT|nr:hypothetical protein [Hymenobacter tibetensis]UOG76359.1 hypothetical protein MTX78_07100 [Hymenobacter tibetensis]
MTTLYLPRRHRRPLLLPRGLVALAFLLLIGCIGLIDQPRLHRYSVMQLTVPRICDEQKEPYGLCVDFAREAVKKGLWQTADFTGNATADSSNLRLAQRHLRAMHHHSTTSGLQIRFHTQARYGSLLDVLDDVNQASLTKYFLDLYSPITTLYVLPSRRTTDFTSSPEPKEPVPIESATTTGVTRWLDRISSHLAKPAWGTSLLTGLSVWLAVALGRWWLQHE